jgi:predicted transcriptional regulator
MTLINAMRTDFPVIDPDSPLAAAASRFAETGFCSLPVVHEGRFIGALDSLDVAARAASGELDPARSSVRMLMRRETVSCDPQTPLEQARHLMTRQRVNTLFVTEPEAKLVGIIDLIALLTALETAARAGPEPEWDQRVRGDPL